MNKHQMEVQSYDLFRISFFVTNIFLLLTPNRYQCISMNVLLLHASNIIEIIMVLIVLSEIEHWIKLKYCNVSMQKQQQFLIKNMDD